MKKIVGSVKSGLIIEDLPMDEEKLYTKEFRRKKKRKHMQNLIDIPFTKTATNENIVVYASISLFKFYRYFVFLA